MKYLIRITLLCLIITSVVYGQSVQLPDHPWNFMNTETIGAYDFLSQHPTYDGRGVIVIICDSGVDMGIPGLLTTSEGKVKVIDAQDFSGQGDISLKKAVVDKSGKEPLLHAADLKLYRFDNLSYQPADTVYWVGAIDEYTHFKNSGVTDINNNGKKDDIFAFVTFPVTVENEKRWVYYIDEDADGNLDDETARFSYRFNQDTFTFRGRDDDKQKAVLTFAMNIIPDKKMASFHAADNSHGTHCAGISAGHQIFGEPTQHGIAPGAQVISCKIGDGALSGGATTTGAMMKAYEYGIEWSKEHDVPVVFSMSYGIGSELEGRSDIEKYLDKVMEENENIIIVKSAGNSGPGLSSAGNPSCSSRPMAIGAMFPQETARNVYGYQLSSDKIFHFSGRGGETAKPDCIAPGAAMSTVPTHSTGQNFWGTSMSCPQISGAAAVLISACIQEDIPFNGALIKRALVHSSSPLPGYNALDQGTGVVNIPRAFEIMKQFSARDEHAKVLDYEISTRSPVYPDEKGTTAYWRMGTYFPGGDDEQHFVVRPIFANDMSADQKANFYRAYTLKSDQPWLKIDKSSTFIRGTGEARINVSYRSSMLQEPGLYVGKVTAYPKSGPGKRIPEFELLNTIIVPYIFSPENDYTLSIRSKTLDNGDYHRYFVQVPPGASGMNIEIAPTPGKYCGVYGYVFDPDGIQRHRFSFIDRDKKEPVRYTCTGKDLLPGIWEIVPYAFYTLKNKSTYDLKVNFNGIETIPDHVSQFEYENGKNPQGEFEVVNHFNNFEGTVSGIIHGYQKEHDVHSKNAIYKFHFNTDSHVKKVAFNIGMSKETWNLFTDVAVNIKDEKGVTLVSSGMGQRTLSMHFSPQGADSYVLEINGGFTHASKTSDGYDLKITEKYYLSTPIDVKVVKNGKKNMDLYPGIPTTLHFELATVPHIVPKGYHMFGELEFKDRATDQTVANVDMLFE